MKKIAFVVNSLVKGGMERVAVLLANQLVLNDYDVTMIVVHGRVRSGYTDCLASIVDLTENGNVNSLINKSLKLKTMLDEFDVVFLHYFTGEGKEFSNTPIFIEYIFHSDKVFLINHNDYASYHLTSNKKLSYYLNSSTKNIISICKSMQKNMQSDYKFNNIKTIYNPINTKDIQSKMNELIENSINYKYILAVGRFSEQKNFIALVRAYANSVLRSDNIKLVIIGKYDDKLEKDEHIATVKEIKRLNLNDDVIILGERDNPFKYMKNALFLVMSSRFEGFGLVLAECLATGTPVVSYDLQVGPNEIIVHEHNGLLVENQNEQKLTEAIDRLYTDKTLYEKCRNNAQESVNKFDVNVVIKEWAELINSVDNGNIGLSNLSISNPHGEFTENELIFHIENLLNYKNIVECIDETIRLGESVSNRVRSIYEVINVYCQFFNCSSQVKDVIMLDVTLSFEFLFRNGDLNNKQLEELLYSLHKKQVNSTKDEMLALLINIKHDEIRKLQVDKWYKFGNLKQKAKIKFLIKFIFVVTAKFINKKILNKIW